jgi:hypothetical protein
VRSALKAFYRRIKYGQAAADFFQRGCIPWTPGYSEYKWSSISKVILEDSFNSVIGTDRYGYRIDERIVELPWLLSRLPRGHQRLLDAGSALNFEAILSCPRVAEKKVFISTLAPEDQAFWNKGVSYVFEDIRDTCFRDEYFDCIACISTLEHVGLDNTFLYTKDSAKRECDQFGYLVFLDVLRSRLKKGGTLYVSFPYGQAKNHGWFQVFDGAMIDGLVKRFDPARISETIFMYGNDRWQTATREEAQNAVCYDINVDKRYADDYCAFSRAVACLELQK